jgi:hypothetical protein
LIFYKSLSLLLPTVLLCAAANASTIFNFDDDTLGTSTTFTDTVDGLSATFSSSADPGGFVVYPSIFETLTGNVLGDPGPASANNLDLDINFSQNLSAITLDFVTADFSTPSPFTLTAYENNTLVGSDTSTGQFLSGFTFPEGEISFDGTFNSVVLSSTAADFAVDNIDVIRMAEAPEPGDVSLLVIGLFFSCLPFTGFLKRRKAACEGLPGSLQSKNN